MNLRRDPEKIREWQRESNKRAAEKRKAKPPKPRKTPPTTGLKRSSPPKPRTPLRKRNPARLKKRRAEDFGTAEQTAAINAMPCVCGGSHPACTGGPSEPSHIVSRGAGGDASKQVPMSHGCHRAWHQRGRLTYCRAIGWTWAQMLAAAERTWALVSGEGMRAEAPL